MADTRTKRLLRLLRGQKPVLARCPFKTAKQARRLGYRCGQVDDGLAGDDERQRSLFFRGHVDSTPPRFLHHFVQGYELGRQKARRQRWREEDRRDRMKPPSRPLLHTVRHTSPTLTFAWPAWGFVEMFADVGTTEQRPEVRRA